MTRWASVVFVVIVISTFTHTYGQVFSTLQGGPWAAPSTWVDGVVPAPGDDVVLVGPVTVEGLTYCNNLTIRPGGSLMAQSNITPYMFHATGTIWNEGTIDGDNPLFPLAFTIGKDLYNEGVWKSFAVIFADTSRHILRAEPLSHFSPSTVRADSATIISDRDAYLRDVEFVANKLELWRDYVTQEPTTFYFLEDSWVRVNEIVGQENAIAGDAASIIGGNVFNGSPVNVSDLHIKGLTKLNMLEMVVQGNLVIEDTLSLRDGSWSVSPKIVIQGDVENRGEVYPNNIGQLMRFDVYGSLRTYGNWKTASVRFMGTGDRFLLTDISHPFLPGTLRADTNRLISESSLRFDNATVTLRHLILQPGHTLNFLQDSQLNIDTLQANGNPIKSDGTGFIRSLGVSNWQNVTFDGTVNLYGGYVYNITGQLKNEGILKPNDNNNNNPFVELTGDLLNMGEVQPNNQGYLIIFDVDGNVTNQGIWKSSLNFTGSGPYTLTTDSSGSFEPWRVRALTGTIMSGSSLYFQGNSPDHIIIRRLVLQNGHALEFRALNSSSFVKIDTLVGNGNRFFSDGSGRFDGMLFQDVVFDGTVNLDNTPMNFAGTIENDGILKPFDISGGYFVTKILGHLINNGSITSNSFGAKFSFEVTGDLQNSGQIETDRVTLNGHATQHLEISDTSAFQSAVRMEAMRSGNSYQWMLNGTPLSGAFGASYTLPHIGAADIGTYKCQIDSAGTTIFSREIVINNSITGLGDESGDPTAGNIPAHFQLFQNYPNPFNPTTTIRYQLPQGRKVRLSLFDVLGRELKTLVDRYQPAGDYTVQLDATGLAAGVYFYRLQAGSFIQTRKLLLAK